MCYRVARATGRIQVIYCVVPPELGEEAYRRLVEHYKDNPHVKVIMDRRRSERRTDRTGGGARSKRDRRQRGTPGALDL
jgi:ribosomal protein L44E